MDKENFINMVQQAVDYESRHGFAISDKIPKWVSDSRRDFVDRQTVIERLVVLHYWQIADDSGVLEGANQAQIDSYKADLKECVRELLRDADNSLEIEIGLRWNPTNDYPGTRAAELYDIDGVFR